MPSICFGAVDADDGVSTNVDTSLGSAGAPHPNGTHPLSAPVALAATRPAPRIAAAAAALVRMAVTSATTVPRPPPRFRALAGAVTPRRASAPDTDVRPERAPICGRARTMGY